MELRRYFDLLWRWLWLIGLGVVLAAGAAYITSVRTVPVYQASTVMLVSQSKATGLMDPYTLAVSDRLSGTYSELLHRQPVMVEVVKRLSLDTSPMAMANAVKVQGIRNTQLIQLSVEDTIPERAAAIANEIPKVFIQQNEAMQTQRFATTKSGLNQQLEAIQTEIGRTQTLIADRKQSLPADSPEMDRLNRDLSELQNSYASLFKSYQDVQLEEAKQLDTLLVTEEAVPPTRPIRPKTAQNTLLAAIVGALLALGIAFVVEYLDDVVDTPDEVQQSLHLTTLGAVPMLDGLTPGNELSVLLGSHAATTEAYRVLRTNLQFASVDRPLRTLLVTSPAPSEGKSLTAANLGAAMAQAGRQVVLVDTDLHRPRLHRVFKLPNSAGITTALLDDRVDLNSLLLDTPVPGLRVLTSGALPPNAAELVGSSRIRDLLERLCGLADIVLLDSPPVMALSDAAVIGTMVDGVLLVIDAGKSRRELAKRAVEAMHKVQARVVGVVLNRMPTRGPGAYHYYYYYHYGEYYNSPNGTGSEDDGAGNGKDRSRRSAGGMFRKRGDAGRASGEKSRKPDVPAGIQK